MDKEKLKKELLVPFVLALLISSIAIPFSGVTNPIYLFLMTAGIYSIIANGRIMLSLKSTNTKLSGGSVAHIGIAMMLIGIMFSSGYSRVISLNRSGTLIHPDLSTEMNTENILLMLNETKSMEDYQVSYKGQRIEVRGYSGFVDKNELEATDDPYKAVVINDISRKGKVQFEKGDTVLIAPENTYYEVEYKNEKGKSFSMFPRAQINPDMGGILASPDIHTDLGKQKK
jgi:cytochrome c-type biogenesis protein CcmF